MCEKELTLNEAIKYLKPIADSSTMPNYSAALNAVMAAAEEVEFTRQFIFASIWIAVMTTAWISMSIKQGCKRRDARWKNEKDKL